MDLENQNVNNKNSAEKYDFSKGCILRANRDLPFLGISKNSIIEVKNDGEYLRVGSLTWSSDQLKQEIEDKVWTMERPELN